MWVSEGNLVTNFVLNMGLMLDALTEFGHLSLRLQDIKVTLPGEFYEEAQNAVNKLEFKGSKLEI
jgi:hypothetical protein